MGAPAATSHIRVGKRYHTAMQAIFVAWYNSARAHETLKGKSPAMASGLADKVWTIERAAE